MTNTLAFLAHLQVEKKLKGCEQVPGVVFTTLLLHKLLNWHNKLECYIKIG